MDNKEQIRYLLQQYLANTATSGERNLLFELLPADGDVTQWERLLQELAEESTRDSLYQSERWDAMINSILLHRPANEKVEKAKLRWLYGLRRIAIAASIILTIGAGIYFIFLNKPQQPAAIVTTHSTNDVKAPATNRAMITLDDGQKIYLDSAINGTLLVKNTFSIVKKGDGQIEYNPSAESIQEVQYNTLTNPRGSKVISMTLSDGTKVWLNAASSVTYPVTFAGKGSIGERKVSINGEVYFEVAKDMSKPFRVNVNDRCIVEVLGTQFNINAYGDDENIKTTLLEGSVKTSVVNGGWTILKPGEQALIHQSTIQLTNPDLEQVMAWKNGLFNFDNADIKMVLKQLERWYDVDVIYEGTLTPRPIYGKMHRDLYLSQVLNILKKLRVNFRIEDRKLIVMPG